jgi:hypothetical protein
MRFDVIGSVFALLIESGSYVCNRGRKSRHDKWKQKYDWQHSP